MAQTPPRRYEPRPRLCSRLVAHGLSHQQGRHRDTDLGAIWDYLQTLEPKEMILLDRAD